MTVKELVQQLLNYHDNQAVVIRRGHENGGYSDYEIKLMECFPDDSLCIFAGEQVHLPASRAKDGE